MPTPATEEGKDEMDSPDMFGEFIKTVEGINAVCSRVFEELEIFSYCLPKGTGTEPPKLLEVMPIQTYAERFHGDLYGMQNQKGSQVILLCSLRKNKKQLIKKEIESTWFCNKGGMIQDIDMSSRTSKVHLYPEDVLTYSLPMKLAFGQEEALSRISQSLILQITSLQHFFPDSASKLKELPKLLDHIPGFGITFQETTFRLKEDLS